jgi:hypothetical protein
MILSRPEAESKTTAICMITSRGTKDTTESSPVPSLLATTQANWGTGFSKKLNDATCVLVEDERKPLLPL